MPSVLRASRPLQRVVIDHVSLPASLSQLRFALARSRGGEATLALLRHPWAKRLAANLHTVWPLAGPVSFRDKGLSAAQVASAIAILPQLVTADFSGNRLGDQPEAWGGALASCLTTLVLSDTQLSAVPMSLHSVTTLQILDLSGNAISALPAWLWELPRLTGLNVENNHLVEVSLPDEAAPALRRLNLRGNPDLVCCKLGAGAAPRLEFLHLGGTKAPPPATSARSALQIIGPDYAGFTQKSLHFVCRAF